MPAGTYNPLSVSSKKGCDRAASSLLLGCLRVSTSGYVGFLVRPSVTYREGSVSAVISRLGVGRWSARPLKHLWVL